MMFQAFMIILLSVLGGGNCYVARRLYQCVSYVFPHINAKIYIGIYILIVSSMFLGFMRFLLPIPLAVRHITGWISAHWMGVFMYLLMLFLAADLMILLGSFVKIIPSPIPGIVRFYSGSLVVLLTTGIVSYGLYNANQVKYVSYDIQLSESSLSSKLNIVMVSDLHLGAINSETNLDKVIQGINKLDPDIVCMVGDIFNDDFASIQDPGKVIERFKSINARYGVYACLGNHDGGSSLGQMIELLEKSNITLLNDEYRIIDDRFVLIGRLDRSPIGGFGDMQRTDITDILASLNTNLPIIVMDHNPSHIEEYGDTVDIILSGHTHKGQVFPGPLFTRSMFIVDYGHYQKDAASPHVIVSSGAGTWGMPMRVGTNSEIVSIVLW